MVHAHGGSSGHPIVSTNINNIDINHPFVDCVETGSMKSFISHDFNDSLLDKSSSQKCDSITRDDLNIVGHLRTKLDSGILK